MNFDELLSQILEIAKYPQEKRIEFINTFYGYYFIRIAQELEKIDPEVAKKFSDYLNQESQKEQFNKLWADLLADDRFKGIIESVTDEVFGKVVEDVTTSATEEQKQQILALLPSQ